jgi:hypothetical protein
MRWLRDMDSKSSVHPTACPYEEARLAVRSCVKTLRSRKPDFARVLAVLQPYEGCEDFADENPRRSAALVAIIRATLADCYRENREYERAADLYRRAGSHRPIVGFDELYAAMVLEQGMMEHYGPALESLRAAKEDASQVPISTRIQLVCRNTLSLKFGNPFRRRRLIRRLSQFTES